MFNVNIYCKTNKLYILIYFIRRGTQEDELASSGVLERMAERSGGGLDMTFILSHVLVKIKRLNCESETVIYGIRFHCTASWVSRMGRFGLGQSATHPIDIYITWRKRPRLRFGETRRNNYCILVICNPQMSDWPQMTPSPLIWFRGVWQV